MGYTIACYHYLSGRKGRHQDQWDDWHDAAQELCDFIEGLTHRAQPALTSRDVIALLKIASGAAHTGQAELFGLVSYRVVDLADAPSGLNPLDGNRAAPVDWRAVGRLARQAQQQVIELNNLAAIAPDPHLETPAHHQASALVDNLADITAALNGLLHARRGP